MDCFTWRVVFSLKRLDSRSIHPSEPLRASPGTPKAGNDMRVGLGGARVEAGGLSWVSMTGYGSEPGNKVVRGA